MKLALARQLLSTALPGPTDDAAAESLFRQLQFLSDYKYNHYEMYHPGRLFLENLYLWLQQFQASDRSIALDFVRSQLIFISRTEFQQLAYIAYHDTIHREHLRAAARSSGLPLHRLAALRASPAFARAVRASLYVGLSDGSRIDYLRRHNLEINNEQVVPHYATSTERAAECLSALRRDLGDPEATFSNLFLVEDFTGSGRTLLREVFLAQFDPLPEAAPPALSPTWRGRLRIDPQYGRLELAAPATLSADEVLELKVLARGTSFEAAMTKLILNCEAGDSTLKGSLTRVATGPLSSILSPITQVVLCPLLMTEYAQKRISALVSRLPAPFSALRVAPAALVPAKHIIAKGDESPTASLCETYYDVAFEDEHTGSVKYGYDACGLPLVLHHNTPNNSLYLLWNRKVPWRPLFVRYERHGRDQQ